MSSTAVGALLAMSAALALNASYLMQHAGSSLSGEVDVRRPLRTLVSLMSSPLWTLGALVGIAGWALHIGAMRLAPLSVVQAFVAGGLAFAAPMAALGLGRRLDRSEVRAIAVMCVSLVLLSLGLDARNPHEGFDAARLAVAAAALGGTAATLAVRAHGVRRPLALGLAGGLLYGAADLALKALTAQSSAEHVLTSPWLPVAVVATSGAFFAFQRGLQSGRPLAVIALMTAATNVSSILGAFAVFGDQLGRTQPIQMLHVVALVLILAAAWRLAPAGARLAASGEGRELADAG